MEINHDLVKLLEAAKEMEGLDLFMGQSALNKTEFRLLQEVITRREMGKDIISSELSKKLGITRSAISQTVTKLEKKNLVQRTRSAFDKKIAYIRLSDYAAAMFEQHCARANALMEEATARFGRERLDRFLQECDDLRAVLREIVTEKSEE